MNEFDRLHKILTKEEIDHISKLNVIIIGIGGVGGHTLEALVRMGAMHITIMDKDDIDITNINRQIIALHSTIGLSKVEVAKKRMLDISPSIEITAIKDFLDESNLERYISSRYDYIIDACDTVTTKLALIKYAFSHKIKIISCMGTGNKFDPTKLEITKLSKTMNDPLAKVMRRELKEEKLANKLVVLASKELGRKTTDHTPGSTALVPPVAGIMIASYVINEALKNSK